MPSVRKTQKPAARKTARPPARTKGLRVFVSGVSGYFARGLLPRLQKDPKIGSIVGVDLQTPPAGFSKLEFHRLDVRDPKAAALLVGCDVFVHLAFVLLRLPGQRDMDSISIDGSRLLLEAAAAAGVKKIIFTSSVVGYGMHPDNPVPLREDHPLRPNADISYSHAKGAVEGILDRIEQEHPDIVITRLRPSTIAGPTAAPARMASLTGSTAVQIAGYNPALQLTHEEDLYDALYLAIAKDLRGAYNAVSDGPMTLPELYAIRKLKPMVLAPAVGRFLMGLMWIAGRSIFAPEWVGLSMYSLVADNAKLKKQGWKPRFTTKETFLAVLRANRVAF